MCDLILLILGLQELVEYRDHVAVDVVGPQTAGCASLWIGREKVLARVQILEVLHDDGGFVSAPCWTMANGGDETAGIDVQERLRLLVWVDLDVLVRNFLVFKRYPDALNKGT